jgi:hypothetical protein
LNPESAGGNPGFGTRITARRVLELLATYPGRADLFAEYASLEPEDQSPDRSRRISGIEHAAMIWVETFVKQALDKCIIYLGW